MKLKTWIKQMPWFGQQRWFLILRHEETVGPYETEDEVRHEEQIRRISPCMNQNRRAEQHGDTDA